MDYLLEVINFVAPFWLTIVVVLVLYFLNLFQYKHKYNRIRYKYVFEPNKISKFIFPLSLLYSFFIFGLIINIVFYSHNPNNNIFTDWFLPKINTYFAIFFSLLISIWGLLVSYNVLKQQKTQIVSFEEFLIELTDKLQNLLISAKNKPNKQFEVYLYDYHPLIGNFSAPKRFAEYKSIIDKILSEENIEVAFITNHQDDLADFFQKLNIDDDNKILANSFDAVNFIKNIETKHFSPEISNLSSTIWKSSNISEYHFIIVDDTSFQYVVLPDSEEKNKIYGIKSEDPFVLDYLKKTFIEKQKTLISPSKIDFLDNEYHIFFEPQSNIESIVVIDGDSNKIIFESDNCFIAYNEIDTAGFKINEHYLKNSNSFYYLVKKKKHRSSSKKNIDKKEHDTIFNVKSRKVFFRELLNSKDSFDSSNKIKYIKPYNFSGIKEQISYCQEELSKFLDSEKYYTLLVNVFYDKDLYRKDLIKLFESKSVPINYISQTPESKVAIEILYTTISESDKVEYDNKYNFNFSKLTRKSHIEYYFSNTFFDSNNDLTANINTIYNNLTNLLKDLSINHSNIFRQWNYIDQITKINFINENKVDNYNMFCGVRERVYKEEEVDEVAYPVATGIGFRDTNNFTLSAIAIKADKEFTSKILNIKTQKKPYEYSSKVLYGSNKPLFQRGIRIKIGNETEYLFVSGTSSIRDEVSYAQIDNKILSQVTRTVESLVELLNSDSDKIISIRNLSYLRIYYKEKDSLNILKTFLYPIIKDVPHIFLETDICRDDLQIEIEGGKF